MRILSHLSNEITENNLSLSDILRLQHGYHEKRRWSVYELIGDRKLTTFTELDRAALWHAARAELTTQPAGIRMAVDGVKLAQELADENPLGAMVLHAAAAWSARYWLEEEAHHEVAFGILLEMAGLPPIGQDEVIEHRGFFPEDNYVRVCMLQACVEIEACANYGYMSQISPDPLFRDVFYKIARDEAQHRQYFISFAKALVDFGVYPMKDVMSMAYTWVRPGAGETYGSTRDKQTQREGYVNWWERMRTAERDGELAFDSICHAENIRQRKEKSLFSAVYDATGIKVDSVSGLERAYFKSLMASRPAGIRPAINKGIGEQVGLAQ